MTGTPKAKENALDANKKSWDIGMPGSAPAAPPAPKAAAPPAPAAPAPPKAPAPAAPKAAAPPAPAPPKAAAPKEEPLFGGLGGGLFDKLKAMVEPEDLSGKVPSKAAKPKAEAIYEDDEMAGGMGAPPSAPQMPFRAEFKKESDEKK